ncbi:MAG: LysE family transporter [Patescibacteria group bacterium]|nr:LysE family transporter [Patescibacteria group bacterium]
MYRDIRSKLITYNGMQLIQQLVTLGGIYWAEIASPGPAFMLTVKNSLFHSRRAGVLCALGIASGTLVHLTYVLLGLGFLVAQYPAALAVLQVLGAAFIIYLGTSTFLRKPIFTSLPNNGGTVSAISETSGFRAGFLVELLNPAEILFFISILSQVITPITPLSVKFLFAGEIVVVSIVWFFVVAMLFSHPRLKEKICRIAVPTQRVLGAILIIFGVKLLLSGVQL